MHYCSQLAILFLFIFSAHVSAQKLSYGVELDPSYHLKEGGNYNFAVGGIISLDVLNKLTLSSGIKIGHQQLSDEIFFNPLTGSRDSIFSFEVKHNATYLGLPLQVKYKLKDKENHFYVNYNFTFWLRLGTNSHETLLNLIV